EMSGEELSGDMKKNAPSAFYFTKEKGFVIIQDVTAAAFTYKVNSSEKPAHLDLTITPPEEVGGSAKTAAGIFELNGNQLKLAIQEGQDSERPKSFEGKNTPRLLVFTMQRDKELKEPDPKK